MKHFQGESFRLVNAGNLLEEGARLVDEAVVLPNPHTWRVHRQATAKSGSCGPMITRR